MYNTEQILVDSVVDRFKNKWIWIKKYNRSKIEILTEVNLWYWIPDIVVIHKKNTISNIRDTILSVFDINILDIIKSKKQISLDWLLDLTKSSKNQVNNSISVLINENIISNKWDNIFSFTDYNTDISDCIAIEVKLKNWKRALNQAHRYKWFANESYVLLPESNIWPALKQIELFKRFNVWLLGYNEDKIIYHFKPTSSKPISSKMVYLLNEEMLLRNNII